MWCCFSRLKGWKGTGKSKYALNAQPSLKDPANANSFSCVITLIQCTPLAQPACTADCCKKTHSFSSILFLLAPCLMPGMQRRPDPESTARGRQRGAVLARFLPAAVWKAVMLSQVWKGNGPILASFTTV